MWCSRLPSDSLRDASSPPPTPRLLSTAGLFLLLLHQLSLVVVFQPLMFSSTSRRGKILESQDIPRLARYRGSSHAAPTAPASGRSRAAARTPATKAVGPNRNLAPRPVVILIRARAPESSGKFGKDVLFTVARVTARARATPTSSDVAKACHIFRGTSAMNCRSREWPRSEPTPRLLYLQPVGHASVSCATLCGSSHCWNALAFVGASFRVGETGGKGWLRPSPDHSEPCRRFVPHALLLGDKPFRGYKFLFDWTEIMAFCCSCALMDRTCVDLDRWTALCTRPLKESL